MKDSFQQLMQKTFDRMPTIVRLAYQKDCDQLESKFCAMIGYAIQK